MFDPKRRKSFTSSVTTVGEVIEELKKLDPESPFGVDGDNYFYLHVDVDPEGKEKDHISLDSSSLDEIYLEQGTYEELPEYEE